MGLLQTDLAKHRLSNGYRVVEKRAAPLPAPPEILKMTLEQYSGAHSSLEKEASEGDHRRLWHLHKAVQHAYDICAKLGKRPEADEVLDKFAGWSWLKGRPKNEGDWAPFPAPEEK